MGASLTEDTRAAAQVKQSEGDDVHTRHSVDHAIGGAQCRPRPGFSERIGNSRPTGHDWSMGPAVGEWPDCSPARHAARTVSCPYEVDAALLGQREHQKSGYLTTDRHGEILPVIEQVGHR